MYFGKYKVEDALQNPQGIFKSPEQVVSDPRLDRTTKLAILRKWQESTNCAGQGAHEDGGKGTLSLCRRLRQAIIRLGHNGGYKNQS